MQNYPLPVSQPRSASLPPRSPFPRTGGKRGAAPPEPHSGPSIATVKLLVARRFDMSVALMQGTSQRRDVVAVRDIAIVLARELGGFSAAVIGRHFGDRDRTVVNEAERRLRARLAEDKTLAPVIAGIRVDAVNACTVGSDLNEAIETAAAAASERADVAGEIARRLREIACRRPADLYRVLENLSVETDPRGGSADG